MSLDFKWKGMGKYFLLIAKKIKQLFMLLFSKVLYNNTDRKYARKRDRKLKGQIPHNRKTERKLVKSQETSSWD